MENENLRFQLQNDLIQHLAKCHLIKNPFQLKWFFSYKCLLVFMCLFKFLHITIYSHVHSCFFLFVVVFGHPRVPSNWYKWHGMVIKCNSMNVKVQLVGTKMKLLHWIWVIKQASKLIVHIGLHIMTWLVQSNCKRHQCMNFKFLNMVHRIITIQSTCTPNHEFLNYQIYVVNMHHRHFVPLVSHVFKLNPWTNVDKLI